MDNIELAADERLVYHSGLKIGDRKRAWGKECEIVRFVDKPGYEDMAIAKEVVD